MPKDYFRLIFLIVVLSCGIGSALCLWAAPIELQVLEPSQRGFVIRDYPVQVGLVFQRGELAQAPGGGIKDDLGNPVPFLAEVTGWWDKEHTSIKWLLLKFKASTDRRYYFCPGETPLLPSGSPLATQGPDQSITVNTGPLVVTLKQGTGNLFDRVMLGGRDMLSGSAQPAMILVKDVAGNSFPTALINWKVVIEENNSLQAVLKATADMQEQSGGVIASVEVRYQFFKNESFVRIYHTMIWKVAEPREDSSAVEVKQPQIGLNQWSFRLTPALGPSGTLEVGKSEYTSESYLGNWDATTNYYIHQEEEYEERNPTTYPEPKYITRYSITRNGIQADQGKFLGGYISLRSSDGYGVGVAMRDLWQMYPKAFSFENNSLTVEFWPSKSYRMGFAQYDILTPQMYWNKVWENPNTYAGKFWRDVKHSQGLAHFIDEYGPSWFDNPYYYYTAQGVSRTHELTIYFFGPNSSWTVAQLNSITQHPVVLRQDPKVAMRVPFMGFEVIPVNSNFPDIEWAIDQLGKIVCSRWLELKHYGLWRFGFLRWAENMVNYRWMDGLQYDQQLIPWILFMRGGDRSYFEEAERISRYAMDVHTNHWVGRCIGRPALPGYMSMASGLPFPWAQEHNGKGHKIHYLSYYYHLTGYRRAKDTMDMVIRNTLSQNPQPAHGRELYNMNTFWANAYEETFDPKVEEFAKKFIEATISDYDPVNKKFVDPVVYLYNGLVLHQSIWPNWQLRQVMLEHLAAEGYPSLYFGGITSKADAIACAWGFKETGDRRFISLAWDIARDIADLVPALDWGSQDTPLAILIGNKSWHGYVLPLLTGYSLAVNEKQTNLIQRYRKDLFCYLYNFWRDTISKGNIYFRPYLNEDLELKVVGMGLYGASVPEATMRIYEGEQLLDTFLLPAGKTPVTSYILKGAQKDSVYRLEVESANPVSQNNPPSFLLLADADIVYEAPSYTFFSGLGGDPSGVKVFAKTKEDVVKIANVHNRPFTIRDATTGQLLYRFTLKNGAGGFQTESLNLGKERMVMFTFYGYVDMRGFGGFYPYFSKTKDSWFDPANPDRDKILGDVDGDGMVTFYDAILTAKYSAGLISLSSKQLNQADVSGNGRVSSYDASLISQIAEGSR